MWASKTSILSPDFSRYLFVAEVLRQMALERRSSQQFQIQILTTRTAYLEDREVFLQGHQDGADDAEFWGNAGIFPTSDSGNQRPLATQ